MICGASGVGKSTLLRALAGLWGYGSGTVMFDTQRAMFVPQRPYVPDDTSLRQVLSYPATPDEYDTEAYTTVLKQVALAAYLPKLEDKLNGARSSHRGKNSGWPLPASCWPARRLCFWMKQRPRWTRRRKRSFTLFWSHTSRTPRWSAWRTMRPCAASIRPF